MRRLGLVATRPSSTPRLRSKSQPEATETLDVPPRLVVLGGGPVGCELAQFFRRVGSQVTLVEVMPNILPVEDAVRIRTGESGEDVLQAHPGVEVGA